MEFCGTASGRDVNKWELCGFTPVKGTVFLCHVPYTAKCPVSMECVVLQEVKFLQEYRRSPDGSVERAIVDDVWQVDAASRRFFWGIDTALTPPTGPCSGRKGSVILAWRRFRAGPGCRARAA